jgi:hypothetical protein
VCHLPAKRTANIYAESKYAFTTLQVHGAIYKERALITSGGKDIKYGSEILKPPKMLLLYIVQGTKRARLQWHWRSAAAFQTLPSQPVAVTAALLLTPLTECIPHYSQEEGKYCKGG